MSRLAFTLTTLATCFLTPVAIRAQAALEGDWVGEYRLANKTRFIIVRFRGGNAGSLDLPAEGLNNQALRAVELSPARVRFEWPARSLTFDGRVDHNTISGDVGGDSAKGTFSLLHLATVDPELYRQFNGAYEISLGRVLTIFRHNVRPEPLFLEYPSGRTGMLFPLSQDTLVAGRSGPPTPTDLQIAILRNAEGAVDGVSWKQGDQPALRGARMPLREEEVVFRNGAVVLSGTLVLPRGNGRWDEYMELRKASQGKPWFGYPGIDAWGPDTKDHVLWESMRLNYFYDPVPALEKLRVPILRSSERSIRLLRSRRTLRFSRPRNNGPETAT